MLLLHTKGITTTTSIVSDLNGFAFHLLLAPLLCHVELCSLRESRDAILTVSLKLLDPCTDDITHQFFETGQETEVVKLYIHFVIVTIKIAKYISKWTKKSQN